MMLPESQSISLLVPPVGSGGIQDAIEITTFESYSFNSHFLTPTDGWSFTIGDESLTDELRDALHPRQRVILAIDGTVQASGYIDKISTHVSRSGGTALTIEGRDTLSVLVDSVVDPRARFTEGMTLLDLLTKTSDASGGTWLPDDFLVDNINNRNVMTGRAHGRKTTKKGKPLKSYTTHLIKPYDHEGALTFMSRVSQRFGLWIWASADGEKLIVGKPDFDQDPLYSIQHTKGGISTLLSANVTVDVSAQPASILASAFGPGGQNPREQFTLGIINPAIDSDSSSVLAAYPKTRFLKIFPDTKFVTKTFYKELYPRTLFLHDGNSKDQQELESFLRRELALRMHRIFTYSVEVEGHAYVSPEGVVTPWTVDTVVTVNDDYCNVHDNLWILSRTFTKSRSGGTKTHLECILLGSLEF